ncbi:hypothetical protein [Melittangium boletus]|uniref:Lipoprotein n=1 Tax=Melittangium boletus DSM 14713 TaxID=1294270 RepID=A0A250ID97_9BACT|nr:hypothetical protein [Melittangium boletus]ATB29819.1 hypothetical protein MEBOL_003274 [Melittangium boletus DSM 14713]
MKKTQWRALALAPMVFILSVCGGAEEAHAPKLSQVRMSQAEAAPTGDDVTTMGGRGHGCPRQGGECRAYCQREGHTSGGCSGFGRGECVCRDSDSVK